MKIVIDVSETGDFMLSYKAIREYFSRKNKTVHFYIQRSTQSPLWIQITEELIYKAKISCHKVIILTKDYGEVVNSNAVNVADFCWWNRWYNHDGEPHRDDPVLVEVVELLGEEAGQEGSKLKVVEIPDDVDWYIANSGEWMAPEEIHERGRVWR